MNEPVEGDQAQHILVAQRLAAYRQGDLIAGRQKLRARVVRRRQRQSRVAAQAPVPAQAAGTLLDDEPILPADVRRVDAEQFVAAQVRV